MSNIRTLKTDDDDRPPRRSSGSGNESDDEDDNHRQGFYVGGSDRSGQEVLGPSRNDRQARLFEAIQRAGAERLTPEQVEEMERQRKLAQTGRAGAGPSQGNGGFRLGGHGVTSEQIGGGGSAVAGNSNAGEQRQQQVVRMYIWQNGFSIDDGPLRQFDDPQNRAFLQALTAKRIPPELVLLYPRREVDLRIERRAEDYVPPKAKPFSGKGHRLGSVVPGVVGGSSASAAVEVVDLEPPASPLKPPEESFLQKAQQEVGLNERLPTTRIQIRFPDMAQPVVAQFNHTHTVDQLRSFIVAIQPSLAYSPFQLMTVYPRKVIENEQQSLKEADLLNAAVLIKFEGQ